MKVLFLADNRTRLNWGCRATSIALKDLIKKDNQIIYTIYGDITCGYYPKLMHGQMYPIFIKIYNFLHYRCKFVKGISKILDKSNIIRDSVAESYSLYGKAARSQTVFQEIDSKIREADAVVVNGEGTFIFSTPARYDTIFYLLILKVAQRYNKKTFCLNAMFSDSPTSNRNMLLINECKEILEQCTKVTAREYMSYNYYKQYIAKNVQYVPDALFTWNKYLTPYYKLIQEYPFSIIPYPEMDNLWNEFHEPYICLSGSSLAAKHPLEAKTAYKELALKLKEIGKVIIVPTCSGDKFLQEVASETNTVYIPVCTNILCGLSLLVNAKALVSGRWHPSILASIGGTPCVFMGSNSHKTRAIQELLEYGEIKEYSAIPSIQEIDMIVNDTKMMINRGRTLRRSIMDIVSKLSVEAEKGNILSPPIKLSIKLLFDRALKFLYRLFGNEYFPYLQRFTPRGDKTAVHISAFTYYGNAGDILLPVVLRDLFTQKIGIKKWKGEYVHKLVKQDDVKQYNECDFIVIGGGGLFLADTAPNDVSGWQWNCSIDMLHKIEKPLVAFAIGYNRFRGQADFKPIFTEHLNAFVEKAVFVGIRNHGSIECLKNYLHTKELQDKLVYQPCMTTLISKIYPFLTDFSHKEDFIAFNCAFDRQDLRSLNDTCLRSISKVALELSRITKIRYYSHVSTDKLVLPYFDELGIKYELIELKKVDQIVKCYAKPKLVIGMRGHAQMIPFGCNTPILSIVSHDKMQWFLDDIHHPEWGVDVRDSDFESKLLESAKVLFKSTNDVINQLKEEQERLYQITLRNIEIIKNFIK